LEVSSVKTAMSRLGWKKRVVITVGVFRRRGGKRSEGRKAWFIDSPGENLALRAHATSENSSDGEGACSLASGGLKAHC
jgi:hypothetical protein